MTQTVTHRKPAPCNAGSAGQPVERETQVLEPETLHPAMTEGDRRPWTSADWIHKFRDHLTVPPMLTERRPAVETMRDYARRGRYAPAKGALRNAGIAWCRYIAVPNLVAARSWEWLTERPARFLVVALTVKALTFIPPVGWLVDHVITPSVNAALWLFL